MKQLLLGISFVPLVLLCTVALAEYDYYDEDEVKYDGPEVPVVSDLSSLTPDSDERHVPILLMFSAEDCEYCERLEEDVVRPMMLSGDFDKRAIFRKVMVDNVEQLTDFMGKRIDAEKFAYRRNVDVTPTLMFVDANGNELAPKVIGYQASGLYMAYVNAAIDASTKVILRDL